MSYVLMALGFIIPLFVVFLNNKITKQKHSFLKYLSNFISFNLITMLIMFNFFKSSIIDLSFSETINNYASNWLKIIIINCVLGVIYIGVSLLIRKYLKINKDSKLKTKWYIFIIVSIILVFVGLFGFALANYFIGAFGNITPEQMIFNFISPTSGMSEDQKVLIVFDPVLNVFAPLILFAILISKNITLQNKKEKVIITRKAFVSILLVFSILLSVIGGVFAWNKLQVGEMLRQTYEKTEFFDRYYVSPNDVKIVQTTDKPRNIIHIYLESMENTYSSAEFGGGEPTNLIPELSKLADEGIVFSNTENKLGGPMQTYGSSWSVAGMINMECGIPLKTAANSYGLDGSFLPGLVNLGDILNYNGYEQTLMFGADADFGGLTHYFKNHGNYNIKDYKYYLKNGKLPKDYYVNWGFEDDKLYEFAKEELTRLSQTGKPFNFNMETADTHAPGYISKDTPIKYDSTYANAISYSDSEAVEFVRWIQQQPFYDNTTIVITGDHLSMENTFFGNISSDYKRTVYNLILNPAIDVTQNRLKNRQYAPSDFFPTILASMGYEIQGDRLGVGTNLFSEKPTLIEELGFEEYDRAISGNSDFYNNTFLNNNSKNEYNPK